ncbi:hypothetical protein ACFWN1_14600 [Streptomyces sp. NPDC058459]|uniref:hypothetical protein n=1 Tax=Streptomyces sp. NPDC058459 TaxID=3346508 RepID=UPI0036560598
MDRIHQPTAQPSPTRRLIATGTRLHLGTRTITVRATLAGVTGTIRTQAALKDTRATRLAELHAACRADLESAAPRRMQTRRDDANLYAAAAEAVQAR